MKVSKYLSKLLRAEDLKTPRIATISTVEERQFNDGESLIMYFDEFEEGVNLSKTSLRTLVEIFGSDDTNDWIGKHIVLYNDKNVEYMGKKVGGIRFRNPKPGYKAPDKVTEREPEPEDDGLDY